MAFLKLGTVLALAAYVVASPLPIAEPVNDLATTITEVEEAKQPLGCSNWLPTVVSGLTNENDMVTIGICAAEPTALVQKVMEQAALEPQDETTTSIITVTSTTSVNGTSPRPTAPRPTTVTVHRTFTVSAWTKTTTTLSLVNCTRTVLAPTPRSTRTLIPPTTRAIHPPSPIPSSAAASPAVLPRQVTSSTTTSIPVTPPPLTIATTPPQRTITRTAWNVTTITQSGDLVRTRYDCSHTIAYAFTVDSTTTILYTVTSVPVTATVVSTLSCNAFGFGIPGLPAPSTTLRTSPIPTPPSSPTSNPVVPTVSVFRRQENSTSSASAVVSPTVVAPSPVSTVVVHLTRTAYRATTVTASVGTARVTYVCSPSPSSTATPTTPTTAATGGLPTGGLPTGELPTSALPTVGLPTTGAGLPTSVLFPTTGLPTIPLPTLTLG